MKQQWVMAQTWSDLLFAHWSFDPSDLAPLVPHGLTLDTIDGHAWLGVVAFRLSDIHLRGLPPVPGVRAFSEVNLRTYVHAQGRHGVLFLSLHCANPIAIGVGSAAFRLPYRYAPVRFSATPSATTFTCARFDATYAPITEARPSEPASLEAWLTERYSYFGPGWRGGLVRCDVDHAPWRLSAAHTEVRSMTLDAAFGLSVRGAPLCHYAACTPARVYAPRPISVPRSLPRAVVA